MKTVGVFEAKTRFSALVADAQRGITTIVTKNGKPVAEIRPIARSKEEAWEEKLARIRKLRKKMNLSGKDVKAWIEEGRRY